MLCYHMCQNHVGTPDIPSVRGIGATAQSHVDFLS